ncbi:MAG: zinc metallopeptidase [Eubacteriales bacterium]|nr:zinc metallopeptidase [Eubacteriales bacterium]
MYYPAYGGGGYFFLLILVMVLGFAAQAGVTNTYKKYSQVLASSRVPAGELARALLRNGGSSVTVNEINGDLTDHFDPRTGVVSLSQSVYPSSSVAALAVAAHEVGHVMQYEEGYLPIKIRNLLLPAASFASKASVFIVLAGVLFGIFDLAMLGVYLFLAMLAFQVVTLPVEFNASRRGIDMLTAGGYVTAEEAPMAKSVLRAAALTYVVAVLSTLVTLLRLFAIANSSRRR